MRASPLAGRRDGANVKDNISIALKARQFVLRSLGQVAMVQTYGFHSAGRAA